MKPQRPHEVTSVFSHIPLMLLAVLCFGCHTPRVAKEPMMVPNGDRVDEVLWRGGQPPQAGIERLKGIGVALVVNLRDDPLPDEAAWCQEQGIGYTNLPMKGSGMPEAEQLAKFVAIYTEKKASGEKVFVHCRHGCDRTGTAVAAVRIVNGWTNADALREAQSYGLAWWLPGYTKFIRGFRATANSR